MTITRGQDGNREPSEHFYYFKLGRHYSFHCQEGKRGVDRSQFPITRRGQLAMATGRSTTNLLVVLHRKTRQYPKLSHFLLWFSTEKFVNVQNKPIVCGFPQKSWSISKINPFFVVLHRKVRPPDYESAKEFNGWKSFK